VTVANPEPNRRNEIRSHKDEPRLPALAAGIATVNLA